MGAFLAARMVIADINHEKFGPESYMEYTIKDKGTFSGDLAAMLNLQDYYDDDPFLKEMCIRDSFHTGAAL